MITKKLIVTRDSDQRLLKMFVVSSQKKGMQKHKGKFPVVLNK